MAVLVFMDGPPPAAIFGTGFPVMTRSTGTVAYVFSVLRVVSGVGAGSWHGLLLYKFVWMKNSRTIDGFSRVFRCLSYSAG